MFRHFIHGQLRLQAAPTESSGAIWRAQQHSCKRCGNPPRCVMYLIGSLLIHMPSFNSKSVLRLQTQGFLVHEAVSKKADRIGEGPLGQEVLFHTPLLFEPFLVPACLCFLRIREVNKANGTHSSVLGIWFQVRNPSRTLSGLHVSVKPSCRHSQREPYTRSKVPPDRPPQGCPIRALPALKATVYES